MQLIQPLVVLLTLATTGLTDPVPDPSNTKSCRNGAITIKGRQCQRLCGYEFTTDGYRIDYRSCFNECAVACAADTRCVNAKWVARTKKCHYMDKSRQTYWQKTGKADGIKCEPKPLPKTTSSKCKTTPKRTSTKSTTKTLSTSIQASTTASATTSISTTQSSSLTSQSTTQTSTTIQASTTASESTTLFSTTSSESTTTASTTTSACPTASTGTASKRYQVQCDVALTAAITDVIVSPGVGGTGLGRRAVLTPFEQCQSDCDTIAECVGLNYAAMGGGCTLFRNVDPDTVAAPGNVAARVISVIAPTTTVATTPSSTTSAETITTTPSTTSSTTTSATTSTMTSEAPISCSNTADCPQVANCECQMKMSGNRVCAKLEKRQAAADPGCSTDSDCPARNSCVLVTNTELEDYVGEVDVMEYACRPWC